MPRREERVLQIKCPDGCRGTTTIEEDEDTIAGGRPSFVSVSDGFRRAPMDDKRDRIGIVCTAHNKLSSY